MPLHDPAKYFGHGNVIKCGDADGIKVTQEARRDRITASPRGTHSTYHLNINQVNGRRVLQVIPVTSQHSSLITTALLKWMTQVLITNSSDPSTDAAVLLEAGHHTLHGPACSNHQQTQPENTSITVYYCVLVRVFLKSPKLFGPEKALVKTRTTHSVKLLLYNVFEIRNV